MQAKQSFPTYVFATVHRARFDQVVAELKKINEIEYIAPVSGRYDLVIRLKTNIPEHVYSLVSKIRAIQGVNMTQSYFGLDGFTNGQKFDAQSAWAFSLLNVNKPLPEVLQRLKTLPALIDAWVVPGQYDIIMSLKGKTSEELMTTVVDQVRQIDGIWMSETLFGYKPYAKA